MRHVMKVSAVLVAILLVLAGSGCAVGEPPTRLTAYFAKAPSLYEESNVMVMGLEVGSVERISTERGQVRVDLRLDPGVPLPKDVNASIVPFNTVGERNVVLFPAYPGTGPRAKSGDEIPQERTDLPVEIDDALQQFTDVAEAVNPNDIRGVVQDTAKDLKGRGKEFNQMINQASGLTSTLAGQDEELVKVAKNLRTVAANLNKREKQLKRAIGAFSTASRILAEERKSIEGFIKGLLKLAKKGKVLIKAYTQKLPQGLSTLSETILTVKANSASVATAVKELGDVNDVVINAWDRKNHLLTVRANLTPTARYWLKPLFRSLGLGDVPCLEKPFQNCPWQNAGTNRKGGGK